MTDSSGPLRRLMYTVQDLMDGEIMPFTEYFFLSLPPKRFAKSRSSSRRIAEGPCSLTTRNDAQLG